MTNQNIPTFKDQMDQVALLPEQEETNANASC